MKEFVTAEISIDNQLYQVRIAKRVNLDHTATRIIIPTYIMNDTAKELVRVCVQSIHSFTRVPYEIWIVDNNSPEAYINWLIDFDDRVNLVLNRTEPVNPFYKLSLWQKMRQIASSGQQKGQMKDGSYANAIGLELGVHFIPDNTQTIFTMHYDTMVTRQGWLQYFKSKLSNEVRAVGFRRDKIRAQALHIAGLLLDYTLYKPLKMSFLPNLRQERFPNQPTYDVGDQLTLQLRANNFQYRVLQNSFNSPELADRLPVDSPFRKLLSTDLCFDDDDNVIYLHLGRGTRKSVGNYQKDVCLDKLTPEQWVAFSKQYILSEIDTP